MNKLEPCPFCGFGARIIDKLFSHFWTYFKVQCTTAAQVQIFIKAKKKPSKNGTQGRVRKNEQQKKI